MTKRFLLPAAFVLGFSGAVMAQPDDAPPSTPTDLVANVYSDTAGAIRWSRSSDDRGAVSGYEVTRDGTVLAVRDALSYVDLSLAPGTVYTYGVTAIDDAGQRSGTATIRLRTSGDTPPATLAAPEGLRASVYSATAAELFWTRPATFGLRYEVLRDGEPLAVTDGTSYFDDTLSGGTPYVYDVIAIDRQGRRSASSRITLRTFDGGAASAGPAAPEGLRASVYSATAAELFWTRPATFGLRFEVLRDGIRLATTDGTSYFDDTLVGGRTYVYEIVAVDREGRRSASSSVSLETPGPTQGGRPSDRPTPAPMPTGLRGEVYSATALELFWERPPASSGVVAFDLYRDGGYLRQVEGPSAFEDGLSPGTTYRYNVVAVGAVGGPSGISEPSTTLVLRTRDAPSGDASSDTGAVTADRLVLRIGAPDGPPTPSRRYVYDDEGFPVRDELALGLPESIFMINLLSYDSAGRRAERRTFVGSEVGEPEAALRLFVSRYDDRGRWLGEDLRSPPDTPVSARFVHEFDVFDRIVSRETRDLDGTVNFRIAYAYDDAGRLVGQENYDSEGRLVAREVFDYVHDEGLLSSSTSISFDAGGNESSRTTFLYFYESGLCDPRWLESVTLYICRPR